MNDFKVGDRVVRAESWDTGTGIVVAADPAAKRVWVNWSGHIGSSNELRTKIKHEASEPSKSRIYLAGPMRGVPDFNFPAFDEATRVLRKDGWDVFSPADHDRKNGFDPKGLTGHEDLAGLGFDLRKALSADLEFITTKADAVAVLGGWQYSSGARAEVATAHALGLPVAYWGYFGHALGAMPAEADRIKSDTAPSGTITNGHAFKPGKLIVDGSIDSPLGTLTANPIANNGEVRTDDDPLTPAGWEVVERAREAVSGEVRTTSSTGGQKGVKPECFSLLPVEALEHVARHYGIGAAKYDRNQWRKGYEWSKSYDAAMRHLTAFWRGEDIDAETGSRHLAAVAFHALTLLVFMDEQPDHDDRYRKETP